MKNQLFAFMAMVWLISCKAQNTTEPNINLLAQDPKCLLDTKWGIDFSKQTQNPSTNWILDPGMYFNTSVDGRFRVGIPPNTYKNNSVSWIVEIEFKYTLNQNRIIFDVKNVDVWSTSLQLLQVKIGQEAIDFAKDFINLNNLGQGYEFSCSQKEFEFLGETTQKSVPLSYYHWNLIH